MKSSEVTPMKVAPLPPNPWLTPEAAADRLGIKVSTLKARVRQGLEPRPRWLTQRIYRFHVTELDTYQGIQPPAQD